jgi:death-on-curing protein
MNLSKELTAEFERNIKECPDIKEIDSPFINVSDVIKAHYILADYFSRDMNEPMLCGMKGDGYNLLSSAISRQVSSYDGFFKYKNQLEISATLFYGLVKNHSFLDGNKRTALLTLLYQLSLYKFFPKENIKFFEDLVVSVAAGTLENDFSNEYNSVKDESISKPDRYVLTISNLLKHATKRRNTEYNVKFTIKDFCKSLEKYNVVCQQKGGKMTLTRDADGKTLKASVSLVAGNGKNNNLGPEVVKEKLQILQLFEQFPTYESIINGDDPMYRLMDRFYEPLKRLKDE